MANYAVGDIQGCYDQLAQLLDKLQFNENSDTLWVAGDLINRGPKNLETINFLRKLPNTKIVLGNHDLHFLAVASELKQQSRSDTLDDLLTAPDLPDIINWLRKQPLIQHDPTLNAAMVHAGIPAIWSIEEAKKYAAEVESVLSGDNYRAYLSVMYGNEPATWQTSLAGFDRLRIITNYLTRIRYCDSNGKLELVHKSDLKPQGYDAWFDFRTTETTKILFGHWAALEGNCNHSNIIALDTGCVWGRTLTAYHIETDRLISVSGLVP